MGGLSLPVRAHYSSGPIEYFDINSSYPSIMRGELPCIGDKRPLYTDYLHRLEVVHTIDNSEDGIGSIYIIKKGKREEGRK